MKHKKLILLFIALIAGLLIMGIQSRLSHVQLTAHEEKTQTIINDLIRAHSKETPLVGSLNINDFPHPEITEVKSEAPDWNITTGENFDASKLPLEGLTYSEILQRAEETNDPDTWLFLVGISNPYGFGGYEPERLRQNKVWLNNAERSGRKGITDLLGIISYLETKILISKYVLLMILPTWKAK